MRYTAMGVAVMVAACPGALGGSAGQDGRASLAPDDGARSPRTDFLLHDNGEPDGSNGYSNATSDAFGPRRTLLDDFVVPAGREWIIEGLEHWAIWNTLPVGSGVGMDIAIREDADGTPGSILYHVFTEDYSEEATGRTMFSRPEYLAWTRFGPVVLPPGRYWFEAAVVGPENNFWLVHGDVTWDACWVNYDDFGGLQPGSEVFGVDADLAWRLLGSGCFGKWGACCFPNGACEVAGGCTRCIESGGRYQGLGLDCVDVVCACAADVDGSGAVDVGDIIEVLAGWGPCLLCNEDFNSDGTVDVEDLLVILTYWGPCV